MNINPIVLDWTNNLGHASGLIDQEQPIILNGITRECTVPEGFNTQVANAYDHKSNLITFECDRIIDGHDIFSCSQAFIKWENLGSETGDLYVISDREVISDSKIRFHWAIEKKATQAAGALLFQICFLDLNEEGTQLIYAWNSKPCTDFSVGQSLFNKEIDGLEPDILGGFEYNGEYTIEGEPWGVN